MLIVTNPNDSNETYTYGKRGRKPKWVQECEDKNLWEVPQTVVEKLKEVREGDNRPPNSLRIWQWKGGLVDENEKNDTRSRCFIVAPSELEALSFSNKYFKHPITARELRSFWKEVLEDLSDCFPVDVSGVWIFDEKELEWKHRVQAPLP